MPAHTEPMRRRVLRSARRAANGIALVAIAIQLAGCAKPAQDVAFSPDAANILARDAVPAILVGQRSDVLDFEHMQLGDTLVYDQVARIDAFVLATGGARPEALHVAIVAQDGMPVEAVARVLVEAGVPPDNVTSYDGGSRLARGQMRLVATLYSAARPNCGRVRRHVDLTGAGELPELGCVQDAALAASIADPLDLVGRPDRRLPIERVIREPGHPESGLVGK